MEKKVATFIPWILLIAVVAIAANSYPGYVRDSSGFDHQIRSFALEATASGDNTLVTGETGYLIKLLSLGVRAYGNTAVNWYLKTDTDGGIWGGSTRPFTADQTGAAGPAEDSIPFCPVGEISTSTAGEDLEINLSAATPLWVRGTYITVPE